MGSNSLASHKLPQSYSFAGARRRSFRIVLAGEVQLSPAVTVIHFPASSENKALCSRWDRLICAMHIVLY